MKLVNAINFKLQHRGKNSFLTESTNNQVDFIDSMTSGVWLL